MDDHRFFLELVAVLVSARLFAAVAVKAGAPAVIGELVAGVILGPSLLGWLEPGEMLRLLAEIGVTLRSEEHTSELQSLMRISYAVFCLKKKKNHKNQNIKLSIH